MNRKLMAVAVAGALAAPAVAFAQASSVQIYGRANLGLDQYEAKGATAGSASDYKSRTRVYDSGSRLGFRGTESLGGGLSAVFQIESGANIDSGTGTGQGVTPNASTGTLATRDSYVGLQGGWGRVTFGRQSIFWVNGVHGQTGANHINTDIPWFNGAAFTGVARTSNVIAYNSPTMNGWNGTLSYSPGSEAAVGGANTNASIWGLTVRFNGRPIDAQYDYANNKAVEVAGVNRLTRSGHKLSVGYPYAPGSRIGMTFLTSTQDNSMGDDIKQGYWGINWEHAFGGNWHVYGMYSKVNDRSGCSASATCADTGATGVTLGLRRDFSKRTWMYASYNAVSNERQAGFDYTGGNMTSVSHTAFPAGADPRIIAVGVQHNF